MRRSMLAVCLILSMLGCKDSSNVGVKGKASGESAFDKEQLDLLARRDALLAARNTIKDRRDALEVERVKLIAAGADTKELDAKKQALLSEEEALSQKESSLSVQLDGVLQRAMVEARETNDTAAREGLVAQREKDLARREQRLADREAGLAAREGGFAKRQAEMCAIAPTTTTIVQTVDVKGSNYSKKDVEPLLKRARRDMGKKGILLSDLSAPTRGLEAEATKAMGKGDFGRAHFAASQLVRSVRATKVDKGFIGAKFGRLNNHIRGKKLSTAKKAEVEKLLRRATESYGDGKYRAANRSLNQIYSASR